MTATAADVDGVCDVEASIDGGAWVNVLPKDGAFDSLAEDVESSFIAPPTGSDHRVCLRAWDVGGSMSDGSACLPFVSVPSASITITFDGGGTGVIESDPPGVVCQASCSDKVPLGSSLRLHATAVAPSHFAGWSNCPAPDFLSCEVPEAGDLTLSPTFDLDSGIGDGRIWYSLADGSMGPGDESFCGFIRHAIISSESDGSSRKVLPWDVGPFADCDGQDVSNPLGYIPGDSWGWLRGTTGAFTADGSLLAYGAYGAGSRLGHHGSVWIADADGFQRREVTPDPYRYNASPLAFTRSGDGILAETDEGLVLFPLDGSPRKKIDTSLIAGANEIKVSPDGSHIAAMKAPYVCDGIQQFQVWVYDLDPQSGVVSKPRRLMASEDQWVISGTWGGNLTWSADGTTLVWVRSATWGDFSSSCQGAPYVPLQRHEIRLLDVASDQSRVIASRPFGGPAFGCTILSPSGTRLLYSDNLEGVTSVVDLATGQEVAAGVPRGMCPLWQPKDVSDALSASTFELGSSSIWVNVDQSSPSQVQDTSGFALFDSQLAPSSSATFEYPAAGAYPYEDTSPGGVDSLVEVAPSAEVVTGAVMLFGAESLQRVTVSSEFSGTVQVAWAGPDAPSGAVFDVERRSSADVAWTRLLTGTPDDGGTFQQGSGTFLYRTRMRLGGITSGWSGAAACDIQAGCSTATTRRSLTVTLAGSGAGKVTSSPWGIVCGALCQASLPQGLVTLVATPGSDSDFGGWSGGGCSGTESCTVSMTDARSVTATFVLKNSVTLTKIGTGAGTVISTPAGLNCGTVCSAQFSAGASVSLSASPSPGSTFAGWSGDCGGSGACSVSVTGSRSVTATFNLLIPVVGSFSPASGGAGTSITITGSNFAPPATCSINSQPSTPCQVLSPTSIVTSVPSRATSGPIRISVAGVTGTSSANFSVDPRGVAPTVTAVGPASVKTGDVITLTGTNLAGATSIKIGSSSVTSGWTVLSATQLSLPVPAGATSGTVAVTTAGGTGTASGALVVNAPDQITNLNATRGNAQVALSWAPPDSHGLTITSYEVRYSTSNTMASPSTVTKLPGGSTTYTRTGLSNGTTYYFQVRALNSGGGGPWGPSAPIPARPATTPAAPAAPTILRDGFGSLRVTTTGTASTGGEAIASYTFTSVQDASKGCTVTLPASALACSVTGLTPGTAYSFKVKATNAVGVGPDSTASSSVTAVGLTTFATTASVTSSNVLNLTPNASAPVPVGSRLLIYYAADNVTASSPTLAASAVSFPSGGAATCVNSYGAFSGATSTAGSGLRGGVVYCTVSTSIPAGGIIRMTLSATPGRAIARGDYLVGFANGGAVTTATATLGTSGILPSITSISVGAGSLAFGAFAYEDGKALLTADTDTSGGNAWSAPAVQQSSSAGLAGLTVFRQYKWIATAATQTYNSTTATPSSADWVAMLLSIG